MWRPLGILVGMLGLACSDPLLSDPEVSLAAPDSVLAGFHVIWEADTVIRLEVPLTFTNHDRRETVLVERCWGAEIHGLETGTWQRVQALGWHTLWECGHTVGPLHSEVLTITFGARRCHGPDDTNSSCWPTQHFEGIYRIHLQWAWMAAERSRPVVSNQFHLKLGSEIPCHGPACGHEP